MSFNGRPKKMYRYFNKLLIYRRGVRVGKDLFFLLIIVPEYCRKYFLFYFPTTHSLFSSATAALEVGLSHLYENTSNLLERVKCDFFVAIKLLQTPHRFDFLTRVAWNFGVVSSFCVYNRTLKM